MTGPIFAVRDQERLQHYERVKMRFQGRERNCDVIHQVRKGNIRQLFPSDLNFSVTFKGSPIANFVDIVARDMAEGLAPLPSLACTSGAMVTDADQKRAERKNRIGDNFWRSSHLEVQMLKATDRYVTYGWVPIFVEPDVDNKLPYINLEDPRGSYYELDRHGNCTFYAKKWRRSVDDLCAMFPDVASIIRTDPKTGKFTSGETQLELVRIVDDYCVTMILPDRQGLQAAYYEHKMDKCPVWIVERPGESDTPRGQFDDVIWVQVARSIYATLALEAAANAVQAPIAVPSDMDEFPVGPHAILQSDNAKDIHRVDVSIPAAAFAENQQLDQELRVGARYPDARTGSINASVVTGKGVEALLGSFDSQIRGAQLVWREALRQATSMCFEMDQKWWPNKTQKVTGTLSGASYEFSYSPAKDINDRFDCTVTYGFSMGLNPSQSLVAILQLEGAGIIAKGTARENLPMSLDAVQEEKRADVEAMRDALKQGMASLAQDTGALIAQGQSPMSIIKLIAQTTKGIQNGMAIEDAIEQSLEAQQAEQQAQQAQQQQEAAGAEAAGAPPDDGAGAPPGAPGPGGPAGGTPPIPQAQPTLANMIAGFRGNGSVPVSQYQVRRTVPTGVQ